MSDEIQNLNPFILPQSSLYQAAVKLAAKKQLEEAHKSEPSIFFNVSQINSLLNRYGAKEWTYEEILAFPMAPLNPAEREFIIFLQKNPQTFKQLASLDHHPESLSMKDIKIAAQLSGDALTLSTEDFKYLNELPKPMPSRLPHPAEPEHHVHAEDIMTFLSKLTLEELTFDALHHMHPPAKMTNQEAEIWHLLQSRSVQKILYNLSQSNNGALTAEMFRTLLSLIWNPVVLGTAPIVFLKSPEFEDEDVPDVEAVPEVEPDEHPQESPSRLRVKMKWRASHLKKLLHRISPETDHVTLEQLRRYQPQSEEEKPIVRLLKQNSVFELLASQDHHPEDLSFLDIELALIERTLILSDPYITLVILP
jgi:hypothetical protein